MKKLRSSLLIESLQKVDNQIKIVEDLRQKLFEIREVLIKEHFRLSDEITLAQFQETFHPLGIIANSNEKKNG